MTEGTPTRPSFLRRWSERKLAASREAQPAEAAEASAIVPAQAPEAAPVAQAHEARPAPAGAPVTSEPLPAPETLTFDSDFTQYLKPGVDPGLRSAALRKLFSDPRFNVMDGLDVYIDDYNKFEPLPPELVKELAHARYLFDPPKTRINAQGHVEDVPEDEAVAEAAEPSGDAVATASETSPPPASDTASAPTGEGDAAPSPDAPHHDSNTAA